MHQAPRLVVPSLPLHFTEMAELTLPIRSCLVPPPPLRRLRSHNLPGGLRVSLGGSSSVQESLGCPTCDRSYQTKDRVCLDRFSHTHTHTRTHAPTRSLPSRAAGWRV
jgi:hypothetical protein